jgi:uncharacterized cofD-like protein
MPKIRAVAIGGGSGLAVLLRGLKPHVGESISDLTAVVTVSDDGGSSGRLRRDFGVPPPGDIRNCIAALADDEALLSRLFQYRFVGGEGLAGHSFGNLLLTALTGITGDFYQAILTAESILSVRGRILPATLADVRLCARGRSGETYRGESAIGASGEPIDELVMEPANAAAFPAAVEAIGAADLILLGPGSLYTSIVPNLLIPGIRRAVRGAKARVVLLLNLMTQPGETDGLDAAGHFAAVTRYLAPRAIDAVLVHGGELPAERLRAYAVLGAQPVIASNGAFGPAERVERDLLAAGDLIRHDPAKLAAAALEQVGGTA